MMVKLVVFEEALTAYSGIRTPELKLIEHSSVEFVDFSWLRGEAVTTLNIKAGHISRYGTLIANDILTRLALNWIDYYELAIWAHQILINFIIRKNRLKLATMVR